MVERRRRDDINQCIQDMATVVPVSRLEYLSSYRNRPVSSGPFSQLIESEKRMSNKGEILKTALDWIHNLTWLLQIKVQQAEELAHVIDELGVKHPVRVEQEEKSMMKEFQEVLVNNGAFDLRYREPAKRIRESDIVIPHQEMGDGKSVASGSTLRPPRHVPTHQEKQAKLMAAELRRNNTLGSDYGTDDDDMNLGIRHRRPRRSSVEERERMRSISRNRRHSEAYAPVEHNFSDVSDLIPASPSSQNSGRPLLGSPSQGEVSGPARNRTSVHDGFWSSPFEENIPTHSHDMAFDVRSLEEEEWGWSAIPKEVAGEDKKNKGPAGGHVSGHSKARDQEVNLDEETDPRDPVPAKENETDLVTQVEDENPPQATTKPADTASVPTNQHLKKQSKIGISLKGLYVLFRLARDQFLGFFGSHTTAWFVLVCATAGTAITSTSSVQAQSPEPVPEKGDSNYYTNITSSIISACSLYYLFLPFLRGDGAFPVRVLFYVVAVFSLATTIAAPLLYLLDWRKSIWCAFGSGVAQVAATALLFENVGQKRRPRERRDAMTAEELKVLNSRPNPSPART